MIAEYVFGCWGSCRARECGYWIVDLLEVLVFKREKRRFYAIGRGQWSILAILLSAMATGQLFSRTTQALFYNYKQSPVQRMLDFDFLCGRLSLLIISRFTTISYMSSHSLSRQSMQITRRSIAQLYQLLKHSYSVGWCMLQHLMVVLSSGP